MDIYRMNVFKHATIGLPNTLSDPDSYFARYWSFRSTNKGAGGPQT
jgi:hypothetical protein